MDKRLENIPVAFLLQGVIIRIIHCIASRVEIVPEVKFIRRDRFWWMYTLEPLGSRRKRLDNPNSCDVINYFLYCVSLICQIKMIGRVDFDRNKQERR